MERKKLTQLIFAVLIALAFITSYVSLTNFSGQQSTTTSVPGTVFAQSVANGIITGYGSPMSVTARCSNQITTNATIANVTAVFTNMENNNSVSNFYNSNNNFDVAAGNLSSYQIYSYLKRNLTKTQFTCLIFTAPAQISLPALINMTVNTQKIQIPLTGTYQNVSLTLPMSEGIGTQLRLRIAALLTANATFYGPINVTLIH
ncbi:MAG: hypothetical protein KGH67_02300 [Candidatus Micrarchaeota archaeon]|nr:hypothetical protein [Candidatus Micrarchaeota archaeon]MDE1859335.1 hypothetical protein [Candidatus Micrarchaeota archaeon]